MTTIDISDLQYLSDENKSKRHPKCTGYYDAHRGDYDCTYNTTLACEECKYGFGRIDPEAKCNQLK